MSRSVYSRGNLEAGEGAITPKIGGGSALLLLPQFNLAAGACRTAGAPGGPHDRRDSRPRIPAATRPVTRGLPAARYHPLGVEQERAGLDELGRIPSKQKEKEALWLT